MKPLHIPVTALITAIALGAVTQLAAGERIVIMHTNDTHSQIDPAADDKGGIARRKVLIDSIRAAEPNTLLVDAGDAVQGTVYFNLYGGEIEARMLNALGYDYAILGNHEFDNGVEALARYIDSNNARFVSTNYVVDGTPLEGKLTRYEIIERGGKKIGLIALNVEPAGIIDEAKSEGVRYQDVHRAANSTAWHLKHNEGVDYVIALTHIGYKYDSMPDDIDVATGGNDIDVIIGAHSHTVVNPGSPEGKKINNDGKPVLITQTGSSGKYLGVVTIDTDTDSIWSQLIPVDSRLDGRIDPTITEIIKPYRHGVDSLKSIVIGKSRIDTNDRASMPLHNFVSGFLASKGAQLTPGEKIDLAISNRGGVRTGMAKGNITKGNIMEMLPFDNRVLVLDVKGSDLLESIAINTRMNRVSYDRDVTATMNGDTLEDATISGKTIDPEATYRIATIDYIANGGDYMKPLTNGKVVAKSNVIMNQDVMDYISRLPRKTVNNDETNHFTVNKR